MSRDRTLLTVGPTAVSLTASSDGRRVVVSRAVDAPADAAWTLLADTRRWPEWGPSVRAVESSDARVRAGTTGRVRTPLGVWLPFEVTACENRRWTWRVAGVPATDHRVVSAGDGACRAEIAMSLPAAAYVPVCARALSNVARIAKREAGRPTE